jgi:hypothetical protein
MWLPRGVGRIDPAEATVMRWPVPLANMSGAAALMPLITLSRLTSICTRAAELGSSENGPTHIRPALLMKMSTGPSSRATSSRNALRQSGSVTSSLQAWAPRSVAVSRAASRSTSPIATCAPAPVNSAAVSRPIPRAPPVIATTCLVSVRVRLMPQPLCASHVPAPADSGRNRPASCAWANRRTVFFGADDRAWSARNPSVL